MNKHYKLLAVLSTAAAMSAATPALALPIPGSVSTVLAATAGWLTEDGELRYRDSEGYLLFSMLGINTSANVESVENTMKVESVACGSLTGFMRTPDSNRRIQSFLASDHV